jgi:aspartyl-tRNA(Asn)/glutamyl-tRNA(Gln) amidotransferase subunit C
MDLATIDRLAGLCKLDLSTAERQALVPQLERILGLFAELDELGTAGVEPSPYPLAIATVLRPDRPQDDQLGERLLALGPTARGDFYRVPQVLERRA